MQKSLTTRNASRAKMESTLFLIDGGQLVIRDGSYYRALSACETLKLLNLLSDYRDTIVGVARLEQRAEEQERKQGRKKPKPKMMLVEGQWVELVDLSALQQEHDEEDQDE